MHRSKSRLKSMLSGMRRSRRSKESAWNEKFAAYAKAYPQEAAEFTRRMKGEMPSDFDAKAKEFIAKLQADPAKIASRKASQNAIRSFRSAVAGIPRRFC